MRASQALSSSGASDSGTHSSECEGPPALAVAGGPSFFMGPHEARADASGSVFREGLLHADREGTVAAARLLL